MKKHAMSPRSALGLSLLLLAGAASAEQATPLPDAPSTVQATLVSPSSTRPLQVGEKVDHLYTRNNTQDYVVAVVNFPRKQIGPLMSECLVTGFHNEGGEVALCVPDKDVPLGTKLL